MKQAEQQVTETGAAGVIAQPPRLFFDAVVLGFVSDHMPPLSLLHLGYLLVYGGIGSAPQSPGMP